MTHVTCRLTAKNRDQLRNHTLGSRKWAIYYTCTVQLVISAVLIHNAFSFIAFYSCHMLNWLSVSFRAHVNITYRIVFVSSQHYNKTLPQILSSLLHPFQNGYASKFYRVTLTTPRLVSVRSRGQDFGSTVSAVFPGSGLQ